LRQEIAQSVGVVGFVSDQPFNRAGNGQQFGAIMTSCMLPGAIRNFRGRPVASVNAWIAVVRPPRERPIASSKAPLFRHQPSSAL
jgi:hypothetical protein